MPPSFMSPFKGVVYGSILERRGSSTLRLRLAIARHLTPSPLASVAKCRSMGGAGGVAYSTFRGLIVRSPSSAFTPTATRFIADANTDPDTMC